MTTEDIYEIIGFEDELDAQAFCSTHRHSIYLGGNKVKVYKPTMYGVLME